METSTGAPVVVLKVGGSLFDWAELPVRLAAFLESRRGERLVLIAGGGAITDQIRAFDQVHRLGDQVAHELAVWSMELTARMLAALLPGSVLVERLVELEPVWNQRAVAVLAPRGAIAEIERATQLSLAASWDVTSDSIAAWVAHALDARSLVLLKSAHLPDQTSRAQAAQLGLVDRMFEQTSQGLRLVEYVNLRENARHAQTLSE